MDLCRAASSPVVLFVVGEFVGSTPGKEAVLVVEVRKRLQVSLKAEILLPFFLLR